MLDLERIREKWLRECGVHDAGLVGMECACPAEDYRHVISDLVEELERQRELLAWGAEQAQAKLADPVVQAVVELVEQRDREYRRAEAAHDAKDEANRRWLAATTSAAAPKADEPKHVPACADCGHRHRWGGECALHPWRDDCGYDAGADCGWSEPLPVAAPDPAATVRRRPDGNAECAFWPDDCPTYTSGTCDGGCTPDPAVELPGMWEDADLIGGQTDAASVVSASATANSAVASRGLAAGAGDGEQDADADRVVLCPEMDCDYDVYTLAEMAEHVKTHAKGDGEQDATTGGAA